MGLSMRLSCVSLLWSEKAVLVGRFSLGGWEMTGLLLPMLRPLG